MKYFQLFVLLIFISSCGGTKNITVTQQTKTPKVVEATATDSITKKEESVLVESIPIEPVTETIEKIAPTENVIIETVNDESPQAFNHNEWHFLLQKHVSNQGNVNYNGFKTDRRALLSYISSLSDSMPNNTWNKEDKLAYWINAYNAMTIDLILRHTPIKSIKDIKDPWDQRYWKLGNKWYNLNEIEHDILRKMGDPRIHFGIVCASFSCPKLQNEAFIASNLENQLTNATKEFLSDSKRNEISENQIKLSKIFQWFGKDFKQNGSLIDFLNKYAPVTISEKAKKSFKDYNWSLNK